MNIFSVQSFKHTKSRENSIMNIPMCGSPQVNIILGVPHLFHLLPILLKHISKSQVTCHAPLPTYLSISKKKCSFSYITTMPLSHLT